MSRMALTLLIATALIAGCGGTDKTAEFKKDFKPVNAQILVLGTEVAQAVNTARGTPDAALATRFLGFASRLRAIRARVDKLDPPDKLKSPTRALSAGLGRLVADLQQIGTAAREHKPNVARAAAGALVRDSQAARDARRELARETGAKLGS
jgi:outer membrane murein-binding lipoprotein Lpp